LELLGIADEDGKEFYKIKVVEGENFALELYDVGTGLLMKRESYVMGEDGEQTMVLMTYANYTENNGLLLPNNRDLTTQGQVLKFETVSRTVNKKIKSKAFSGDFKAAQKQIGKL
jgi:hypothetical protein